MTTVLIVDDHAAFRRAARALLEADGYDVIGEAANGVDGIDQADRMRPDVVLLDVQLPDVDGFEVAVRIADLAQAMAVVLISSRDRTTYGDRLATSPARGFLDKSALSGDAIARLIA